MGADSEKKIRVVLADDHAVMREGTRLILDAEDDIEVIAEAEDGEEAARLCLELCPDVVLLDIKLKGLNGVEAAKRIHFTNPDCAILALSAYDYEQYVKAMMRAGALGYMLKSASGREVVEAVRLASTGASPLSASIAAQMVERSCPPEAPTLKGRPSEIDLSDREIEVLRLVARGAKNARIAEELDISVNTVETHVKRICTRLGAATRGEAVVAAMQRGYLESDEMVF
jgi:DNA-binding NarL/FixJ family response regulator